MATLQIRPDIRDQHSSLFGAKSVNGRTLVVEDVIADMTRAVSAEFAAVAGRAGPLPGRGRARRRAI